MDFLQIALIFLILLLSIFLSITGIQVFFILRDLKKALDKLNEGDLPSFGSRVLKTSENIETPDVVVKKEYKPKPKRFYKKIL